MLTERELRAQARLELTYASVCFRMLPYADASSTRAPPRERVALVYTSEEKKMETLKTENSEHTSAYVSARRAPPREGRQLALLAT
jgi:hypothetical protein